MSVIIRLQNLPWSANALDIRQYFHGLSIPEGGVHIVGGEQGDAFIAFSTDEDARQAFTRNNGKIKEVQITLMLSSRTEMQRVIEQARTQSYAAFMAPQPTPAQVPLPAAVPAIIPAAVPELKKDDKDSGKKREKKRSRSKSRDRDKKDRSRDRDRKDRRHRSRSRSRSRDRRERRRRDRSRSRGHSRSKDRETRRNRDHKRSEDQPERQNNNLAQRRPMPEVWANPSQVQPEGISLLPPPSLLGSFPVTLDDAKRNLESFPMQMNGFPGNNSLRLGGQGNRGSWPPGNPQQNNFPNNRQLRDDSRMRNNSGMMDNRNNRGQYAEDEEVMGEEYPVNSCVVMEPFYGSYGDLRRFFTGLYINYKGIKLINDQYGHRTGICYVRFSNPRSKEEAIKRDGQELNGIAVKVSHLEDEDYDEAVDRYNPNMEEYPEGNGESRFRSRNITKYFNQTTEPELKDFSCLKIEDLPTYVKEQDILHMFSLYPLTSLHLINRTRGGHLAYVKFTSKEVCKQALNEKAHHVVGGKQVTVKPCKDSEFDEINSERDVALDDKKEPIETDCLSVSNLPQKVNSRDIADFFSDIGVIPTKIHLMSNNLGFTGQAYCEFESKEEAKKALTKDNSVLGNANINVSSITKGEMEKILGNTVSVPPVIDLSGPEGSKEAPEDVVPHVKTQALQQHTMHVQPRPPMMHFRGPGMNRPLFMGRGGFSGGPGPRGPRFVPRGGPRHRFPGPPRHHESNEDAPPGCSVYMDNVPYKAGTNEILDFFEGYNCTNNVSRRYNPNNTPSAEAKVTFHTPEEAFRAVQELNGRKIWERSIYLEQA